MSRPFKIAMAKGDGMELYGQGETLCDAMKNLIRAVDEYGDDLDKAAILDGAADLLDTMPHPGESRRLKGGSGGFPA